MLISQTCPNITGREALCDRKVCFCYLHHSLNLSSHLILPCSLCSCCQSVILTYKRALSGLNFLYCACPASKESILFKHTRFAQSTPGETFLEGSHQSVLWLFSGKVSSSPIKRLPSLSSLSPYISICISFWFTSENDPLRPINFNHFAFSLLPPRDNWSELENGIPASTLRDKALYNWLYSAPSICPSAAINLKPRGPHGPKDLSSTSHEMCN